MRITKDTRKDKTFSRNSDASSLERMVFFRIAEDEEDELHYYDFPHKRKYCQGKALRKEGEIQNSILQQSSGKERVEKREKSLRSFSKIPKQSHQRKRKEGTVFQGFVSSRSQPVLSDIRPPRSTSVYRGIEEASSIRTSPYKESVLHSGYEYTYPERQSSEVPSHLSSERELFFGDTHAKGDFEYNREEYLVPEELLLREGERLFMGSQNSSVEGDLIAEGEDFSRKEDKKRFLSIGRRIFSRNRIPIPNFSYAYVFLGGILLFGFSVFSYAMRGEHLQGAVLGVSNRGVENVFFAVDALKQKNFLESGQKFEEAAILFRSASNDLSSWAGILSEIEMPIPFLSKITSGKNVLQAGEHLSLAGKYMSQIIGAVSTKKETVSEEISFLEVIQEGIDLSSQVQDELVLANKYLQKVRLSDIPENKQEQFLQLKRILPIFIEGFEVIRTNAPAFTDVLGGNGSRKYLFLFQNNQESRATGGFIGSYGLLDIKNGKIRKFLVDGIFNPDGQLREDIIPPQPLRKISAGWSLHDSNWFADFPTSAEKAVSFYEKTGGATVDGVVAITPNVLQGILEVVGPVYLPEYDVTVNAQNAIEMLQYEVEVDYDKEENEPKKIVGDLAMIVFGRIMETKDSESVMRLLESLHTSLREKHILLYARNETLQGMYKTMGWSGELKETSNDFLSVVNSNINGYKTDGVVNQAIKHHAEIQEDGTVVDTVTVTRKHTGGDTPYAWWNAVNADYLRLYVPKGSQLLSVKGHTREIVKNPLDYDTLGFQWDALVQKVEQTVQIHPESGTQVFEESGKTVFGNWVYVSPKESVTVEYTYVLPFRVRKDLKQDKIPYSLLTQKQSGSVTSEFLAQVSYPEDWEVSWSFPDARVSNGSTLYTGELRTDVFQGYVFEK